MDERFKSTFAPQCGPSLDLGWGGGAAIRIEQTDTDEFLALALPQWDALQRASRCPPFLHPEHLALWSRLLGKGIQPYYLLAWEGGQLSGYAPLMTQTEMAGPVPVRTLRFVGNNIGYPGDILYADVVARENSESVEEALWSYAAKTSGARMWDLGFINPASPTYRIVPKILRVKRTTSPMAERLKYVGVDLPDSWEEFVAGISRNTRQNFRRRMRKLKRQGEVQVHVEQGALAVRRRVVELIKNHERWAAGTPRESWFGGSRAKRFLAEAGELLAKEESYLVFTLQLDDEPLAWSAGAIDGNRYFEQLISYNHDFASISPGTNLSLLLVKNLLEMGVSRLELGPGYDQRKGSLGGQPRSHHRLIEYRGWLRLASRIRTWMREGWS